jgi:hypothetical protein
MASEPARTADLHDLRLARKRRPIPIPASACRIISDLGGDQPETVVNVRMRLRTVREGTEINLHVPGFSWNLSHSEKVWPKSFKEARKWAAAYAARYGQTFEEIVKERWPVGSREDRALLKAGGCKEAWLKSDAPALFAEAAVRCHHAGAFCMSDGYCHLGDCDMIMDPVAEVAEEV